MAAQYLPAQATSFVGREGELSEIAALLRDPACRLLTLVGAGGIGKTRLALQAAHDQLPRFSNGVYFVPLQPLTSSDLLPSAIASALKITFYGSDEPRLQIIHYLREKHLLLILDNFEHLLDGVGLLSDILEAAPEVKLLVTSRERLNVQEEWTLMVDGLAFPDGKADHALGSYEAVQLFVQRARQVQSGFSLKENAEAVKSICQQVEGMPLGIELAVSGLRVMTCPQIAEQMAQSMNFLATPLRNVPERHRSIRAAFEQSWKLLSEDEQKVLMRLSVFRGGFDLEAAGEVADATLPTLASLADKSLIRVQPSGRYDLHELLRQFATDKLMEAGESEAAARKHLDYFMKLAEEMEADLFSPRQQDWLERMTVENANLRAALGFALSAGNAESGLRMAGALGWFWHILCYWEEGRKWLEPLLEIETEVSPSVRAYALYQAGDLATINNDHDHARLRLDQALDLARKIGDKRSIAWSLSAQGYLAGIQSRTAEAKPVLEEALVLLREMNDKWGIFHTLFRLAMAQSDSWERYMALNSEALALARTAGAGVNIAWGLTFVAIGSHIQGDSWQADGLLKEAVSKFRAVHDRWGMICALDWIGIVTEDQGDYIRSRAAFKESVQIQLELGNTLAQSFNAAIWGPLLAWSLGDAEWATRVISAHKIHFEHPFWIDHFIINNHLGVLRSQLGDEVFEKAWEEGETMTIEQAVAYALGEEPLPSNHPATQSLIEPLSEREREVLRLMAAGLSNPQIAEKLVVATGTIKAHTNSIFGKLGVSNRVQAVNRAKELKLV